MAYTGTSIVDYLKSVGKPSSYDKRAKLAGQYGISGYTGTAQQNTQLLGLLRKPAGTTAPVSGADTTSKYIQDPNNKYSSIPNPNYKGTEPAPSFPKPLASGEQLLKDKLAGKETPSGVDILKQKLNAGDPFAAGTPGTRKMINGEEYIYIHEPGKSSGWSKVSDWEQAQKGIVKGKTTSVGPTAPLAKYDEDYLRNRGAGTPTEPTTPLTIIDQNKKAREDIAEEVEVSTQAIFDNIPDTDKIDTRNSVKILEDIKDTSDADDDAPPKPDSMVDLFNTEKAKLGIEPLETERADLLAQKDRLQVELMIQAEEAGEQLMSMREIGRAKGSIQKRFDREMALLNIEISAVERTLNNKLNTLEMITTLTQQDFTNSSAYYEEQFDKKVKLYSLLSQEEDKEYTRAERAKDEAVVNWDMVTGLLKEQGITYDSLTDDQKFKIKELEVQGGLPVGIGESLLSVTNPDKDVIMKGTSKDNTQAWIKYSDGSMETFDTGLTGETDGGGKGGTGGLLVELEDGSQVDMSTSEGLKKAVEAGYSYEYLNGFLDTNTKLDAGSRAGLLKEAGATSIKEKEKKEEEQFLTKDYFRNLYATDLELKKAAQAAGFHAGGFLGIGTGEQGVEDYLNHLMEMIETYREAGYSDKEILKQMQ